MTDMAIAGQSNGKIAAWLSAGSVPCPKGGYSWTAEVVRVMLRNPSLAGGGNPVQRAAQLAAVPAGHARALVQIQPGGGNPLM